VKRRLYVKCEENVNVSFNFLRFVGDEATRVGGARLSARVGLPQQALNRAIVAASFGYAPSKARLPNGSPAAAGNLRRGYNQSLTISNQKPCYRGGRW
jgi:hypothetical protein